MINSLHCKFSFLSRLLNSNSYIIIFISNFTDPNMKHSSDITNQSLFEDITINNSSSNQLSANTRRKKGKSSLHTADEGYVHNNFSEQQLKRNDMSKSDEKKFGSKYESPAIITKIKLTPLQISPEDQQSICNCKKSKCLKLYCECFAALRLCENCNCLDCNNNAANDKVRKQAINITIERNPVAFQTKVSYTNGHTSGCRCKQSRCLKKYCECFQGSVYCSSSCNCLDCNNNAGLSSDNNFTRASVPSGLGNDKIEDDYHVNLNGLDTRRSKMKSLEATNDKRRSTRINRVLDISPNGVDGLNISPPQQDLQKVSTRPLKIARLKEVPAFPFFGPHIPKCPKIILLRIIDALDGKSIYSSSVVNSLWSQVATDDALWESE